MKKILLAAALMLGAGAMTASAASPKVHALTFSDNAYVQQISNNGRYAVYTGYLSENTLYFDYARLVDLNDDSVTELWKGVKEYTTIGAFDVSDDGLVVGTLGTIEKMENPAYWTKETGWVILPYPKGEWEGGRVASVTPDGKYAVGKVYKNQMMTEEPMMWNLTDNSIVELPGIPRTNMNGFDSDQVRLNEVTPDGRYILGMVDFSYPQDFFSFLYDRQEGTYKPMGYTIVDGKFVSDIPNAYMGGEHHFSPDGKLILGSALVYDPASEFESTATYVYNVADGTYKMYSATEVSDCLIGAVSNAGVPFVCTPGSNPARTWHVYTDGYWVSSDQILKQIYNTDMGRLTSFEDCTTGTIMGIDNSGRKLACLVYDQVGYSYIIEFDEDPSLDAAKVDLLADFHISPAAGAHVSSIKDLTLTFERNIQVLGQKNAATLVDEEGTPVAASIKFAESPTNETQLEISFRKQNLQPGKKYTVVIPAGAIKVKGEGVGEKTNSEIKFSYTGREAAPVKVVSVSPETDVIVSQFNSGSNPIILSMDASIKVAPEAAGRLDHIVGDEARKVVDLAFVGTGNRVYVYPRADQYLFKDNEYQIVIEAGAFTDLVGENPSEEIVLTYHGGYERPINPDAKYLFYNNFNDGSWINAFLFFENDHQNPSTEMTEWGFLNGDEYPWWIVRDDENSEDWSAVSHSMYSPSGKSSDWMIIPQTFIPDANCSLTFQGQSYHLDADDYLSVYVLASDDVYNTPELELLWDFQDFGKRVFYEKMNPGKREGVLEGEWTEYAIDLAPYAGKNIYLAFVNENKDQSAIFLDEVAIQHNVDFLVSLDNDLNVTGLSSVPVKGRVRAEHANKVYNSFSFRLLDADANEIDNLTITDLEIKHGDTVDFTFEKELPLKSGAANKYSVEVTANDGSRITADGVINNLLFTANKRVVLEEVTGQGCPNCPLGHIMIDRLHAAYGDNFIPVAYHTYTGDNLASGLNDYTRDFLGLNAAPSGIIDRNGQVNMPIKSDPTQGYVYSDPANPLWWDAVAKSMSVGAIANIDHENEDGSLTYPTYSTANINIPVKVTFSLDQNGFNTYILNVITEDGLVGYQANNLSSISHELLGEWGKGGIYGKPAVLPYTFNHVARAVIGDTYTGTSGLIPSNIKAGEDMFTAISVPIPNTVSDITKCNVVTMLIDGNNGSIINAVASPLKSGASVSEIAASDINVFTTDEGIVAEYAGDFTARAIALDGTVIAYGEGNGSMTLNVDGFKGVCLVQVAANNNSKTFKVVR